MGGQSAGTVGGRPNPMLGMKGAPEALPNPTQQYMGAPADQASQFGAGFGGGRPPQPIDKYGDTRPTGRPAAESDNFSGGGGAAPVGGGLGDNMMSGRPTGQSAPPQDPQNVQYQRDGRMANFGGSPSPYSGSTSNSFIAQGGGGFNGFDKGGDSYAMKPTQDQYAPPAQAQPQPDPYANSAPAPAPPQFTPQMSKPYTVTDNPQAPTPVTVRPMPEPQAQPEAQAQPFIPQMSTPYQANDGGRSPLDTRFNMGDIQGLGGTQFGNPMQQQQPTNPWEASQRFNQAQQPTNGGNASFNQSQQLGAQPQAQQTQVSQAISAPQYQGDSGGGNNPNLQGVADNIRQQFGRGLTEGALPALRSQAVVNGQLGGSRQGIAEGLATGRAADGLAGALSNMYSQSYEADQGRKAQASIAAMQANAQAAIASGQMQSAERMFNAGQSNEMNRFGTTSSLNQQNFGLQRDDLNLRRELGFTGFDVQRQGQGNQYDLGLRGVGQQAAQNQTNRDLGYAGIDVQRGNLRNSEQQTANQYSVNNRQLQQQDYQNQTNRDLGYGTLDNSRQQTANQYSVNNRQLQQQDRQNANQYNLGLGNLALGNRAQDNSYEINRGQLALANRTQDNNYNLGNRGADNQLAGINSQFQLGQMGNNTQLQLGQMNNETNRQGQANQFALGMGNLGLQGRQQEQNFYTANRGQDLQAYGLGAQLTGQGQQGMGQGLANVYNNANTTYNAPWDQLNRYNQANGQYLNLGQTQTNTQQMISNPTQQWLGSIAQLVGAFNGGGGGGGAAATAAKVAGTSDIRMKDNIKRVGTLDDGLPVYTFTYKGQPEQTHMGVMAQEAELLYPDAVITNADGIKHVFYDRLGV